MSLNCRRSKFTRPGEHLAPKAPLLLHIAFAQSGKFKTGRGTYTFYLQEVLIRVGQTENQMKEIFNPHSLCHYKPKRRVSTSLTWAFLWDSSDVILPSFLKLHNNNSWGPSNEKDPYKMTNAWSPQPIKPPESLRGALKAVWRRVLSCWENKLFFTI